jgi:hypothetical protein
VVLFTLVVVLILVAPLVALAVVVPVLPLVTVDVAVSSEFAGFAVGAAPVSTLQYATIRAFVPAMALAPGHHGEQQQRVQQQHAEGNARGGDPALRVASSRIERGLVRLCGGTRQDARRTLAKREGNPSPSGGNRLGPSCGYACWTPMS